MAKGKHVPSGRFNGGEKVWFWGGVVVLSVIVAWSGLILLFPNFDQTRAVMQEAWIFHASAALLYVADLVRPHLPRHHRPGGRLQAMRTGYVDETWAKEHHEIWYDEVKSGRREAAGRRRARRRAAHEGEDMKKALAILAAGLLLGAVRRVAGEAAGVAAEERRRKEGRGRQGRRGQGEGRRGSRDKAQDKAVANYKKQSAAAMGKK